MPESFSQDDPRLTLVLKIKHECTVKVAPAPLKIVINVVFNLSNLMPYRSVRERQTGRRWAMYMYVSPANCLRQ